MKILRSFYSAGRRNALLVVLLLAGASMSAQQSSLQVIPNYSTARVFLGTPENPKSFDVGIAKVTGEMQLSSDDLRASRFNLTIQSAELKYQKVYGERSVITFQSDSVEQRNDGKLEVHGQLTVTQEFGEEGGNEDSPGTFDNSKRLRTSQEVTFIVDGLEQPTSASDLSSRDVVPVQENESGPGVLVTASTSINGETFPQLLLTIQDVAWPLMADDQNCAAHSAQDDDHSGATCPVTSPASSPQPGENGGGFQEAPPEGNLVTIQLKLMLASTDSDSADGLPHTDTAR